MRSARSRKRRNTRYTRLNPAQPNLVLREVDYVGTLVPGRLADLIAVEGDPSVRISDLRAVRMVMKEGKTMAAGRLAESTQNSTRMR